MYRNTKLKATSKQSNNQPNPETDLDFFFADSERMIQMMEFELSVLDRSLLHEDIRVNNAKMLATEFLSTLKQQAQPVLSDYPKVLLDIQSNRMMVEKYYEEFKSNAEVIAAKLQQTRLLEQQFLREESERQRDSQILKKKEQLLAELSAVQQALETQGLELAASSDQVGLICEQEQKEISELHLLMKKLNSDLQEIRGNIRVYCRIRPFSSIESANEEKFYSVQNESMLLLNVPNALLKSGNQAKEHKFSFERVFENATQRDVFNELAQLIQSTVDGKNVCVFAYGQTGSGKTYTMEGGMQEDEGVIPRSVSLIFEQIEQAKQLGWRYTLQVSIMEIYMDNAKDLLNLNNTKEDPALFEIENIDQIWYLLDVAHQNRKVAETSCNERSSRSHCIFQLKLRGEYKDKVRTGTLSLIDLAGSERVDQSKVEGLALKETMSINKSLTLLSTVIIALAKKQDHIPYRNSKLTHVLQNYLSGDSKTLMMVMISPLVENFNQTICSLRFAETVTECILKKNEK